MRIPTIAFALSLLALPAGAEPDHRAAAARLLEEVAVPGSAGFVAAADALRAAAPPECGTLDGDGLRAAFQESWDAWMAIQHLRFGPIEDESRILQVAFWPDSRGTVGRTTERTLAAENAPVDDPVAFAKISVGARGLPAFERVLYDDDGPVALDVPFRCAYAAAIAEDLHRLASEIEGAWTGDWGASWTTAGEPGNAVFLAPAETSQRLFAATLGALEETARNRLGTPLGTVSAVRPRLAEARRSGRSLRQIALILDATERTVDVAFGPDLSADARGAVAEAYSKARTELAAVEELGDLPTALAESRIRVEILQQSITGVVNALRARVGPALGIAEGFNSADGD